MPDEPKKLPFQIGAPSSKILNDLMGEEYQRGINVIMKKGGFDDRPGAEIIIDALLRVDEGSDLEQEVRGFLEDSGIVLEDVDFHELVRCIRAVKLIDKKMN